MSKTPEKQSPQVEEGRADADQLAVPSEKKLKANRENAKKSTGPRTERGKAHSRKNAIKHGLFARPAIDFFLQNESWPEYVELLEDLRAHYEPVGRAEELEVERIAQSWWRLKRADRYENATKLVAVRDVALKEVEEQFKYCDERDGEEKNFILQLQKLSDEIEAANQAPSDLRERIVAIRPEFGKMWPLIESTAQQSLKDPPLARLAEEFSPEERSQGLALLLITVAKSVVEYFGKVRRANAMQLAYDQHALPNSDALDRMLRYEAAIDRNLRRAEDNLERLQRRRRGEVVLPPVRLRLTRES